MRYMADRQN
uniref:Uncharacterized protein n=1 Tax=Anguilla anguilla TaxID=7936 RepID=A0A0E9UC47_ANGAN